MDEKKAENTNAATNETTQKNATDVKYSPLKKFGFGLGLGGYNLMYSYWVNNFFSIFCTDTLGISAQTLTSLTATVQSFDAIKDPILGGMLDHTHTKWGRYRPFVVLGAILTGFSMCAMFAAQADWSMGMKIGWIWVLYIIAVIANTVQFQAYGALQACMTSDAQERGSISLWRMIGTGIGNISASYIGLNLLIFFSGGSETYTTAGYFWAVTVCAALGIIANFITFFNSREVVTPKKKEKIPIMQSLKCIVGNPYMILILIGMVVNGLMNYGRLAQQMYYLTYVVGDATLAVAVGVIGGFGTFVGGPIFQFFYKFTKNKGRAISLSFIAMSINMFAVYFCPVDNHILVIILLSLAMAWAGAVGTGMYAVTGDVSDYSQLKYGLRVDGLLSSTTSFAMKIGRVIVTAMATALLASAGYVANQEQTQEVINTIMFNVGLFPALITLVGAIIMWFYKLSDKRVEENVAALNKRGDIG